VRAHLSGTVVGEIGKPGLVDPNDRIIYTGAPLDEVRAEESVDVVYGFGEAERDATSTKIVTAAWVLPIATVLLLPLLIFVTTASRMGAAQRERRLAALRLIGLDARQVRRVAAAESLLGAVAGLIVGTGLFLLLRPLLSRIELGACACIPATSCHRGR
jgi:cell division protein FtsX